MTDLCACRLVNSSLGCDIIRRMLAERCNWSVGAVCASVAVELGGLDPFVC